MTHTTHLPQPTHYTITELNAVQDIPTMPPKRLTNTRRRERQDRPPQDYTIPTDYTHAVP